MKLNVKVSKDTAGEKTSLYKGLKAVTLRTAAWVQDGGHSESPRGV